MVLNIFNDRLAQILIFSTISEKYENRSGYRFGKLSSVALHQIQSKASMEMF